MSKISMHQNIYHLYLILEKLAQKMEKNKTEKLQNNVKMDYLVKKMEKEQ